MSDILARLLLNTSDYDKKMSRAKKSTEDFGSSLLKGVGSAATKVAGALGVAMGAAEAFDKVIKGSQTTADEFDKILRSAKTSVDSFFTAISTGDFTVFLQGLDGIINRARLVQGALDQLGNTTMSYGYFNAKNQAEFAEAITTLRDKNATQAEKDAAKATADRILGSQREITEQLRIRSEQAAAALVTEGNTLNLDKVTRAGVEKVLRLDVMAMGDEEKESLSKRYKEYVDYYNKLASSDKYKITKFNPGTGGYTVTRDYEAINRDMAGITEQYQDAILFNEILVRKSDDWLQNLINIYSQSDNAVRSLANMVRQLNRVENTASVLTTGGGLTGGNNNEGVQIPVSLEWKNYQTELGQKVVRGMDVPVIKVPIEIEEEDLGEVELPQLQTKVDDLRSINEELAVFGSIMSLVNGTTAAGAEGWMQWMNNVVQATSTAIPAIRTVVDAKTAEGAASAGASAAQSGPFGWLMIAPAIVSALAAFASIPKFAQGGIIGGSSFAGDKLLARVNSGEMILNQNQQSKLLAMTSGQNVRVSGDVRLNGKDIYISLRNYMASSGNRL